MTKIIAFHLPQFHAIPENDEWWGKGFTEWTNTKKAKPLFKDHNQPREPLNYNYYNMLDHSTRKWQADLAQEHGVYGFCYYHYWFNGKMLLEKPVEMLLEEKDITMPFCFCWANEPWTRAWDGATKEVIMPQEYGGEKEWQNHFDYLIKFFKDDRYIKKGNKPVFVIYRTSNIPNCDKMIEFFDDKCKKAGLAGIHVVEEINSFQQKYHCKNSKGIIEFEPINTLCNDISFIKKFRRKVKKIYCSTVGIDKNDFYDYDYIWNRIINRNAEYGNKEKYLGAFIDWDNSPRKGKAATIFKGVTIEKFEKYFKLQLQRANNIESEFLFINAWNEWAEGTYLEPDTKNEYKYLNTLKRVVDAVNSNKNDKI